MNLPELRAKLRENSLALKFAQDRLETTSKSIDAWAKSEGPDAVPQWVFDARDEDGEFLAEVSGVQSRVSQALAEAIAWERETDCYVRHRDTTSDPVDLVTAVDHSETPGDYDAPPLTIEDEVLADRRASMNAASL